MLAYPEPAADRAATLAAAHLTALATVPALTDIPTSIAHAEQLAKQVRRYLAEGDVGMLGENGIEPAVLVCVDSARRIGFDWRQRWATPEGAEQIAATDAATLKADLDVIAAEVLTDAQGEFRAVLAEAA